MALYVNGAKAWKCATRLIFSPRCLISLIGPSARPIMGATRPILAAAWPLCCLCLYYGRLRFFINTYSTNIRPKWLRIPTAAQLAMTAKPQIKQRGRVHPPLSNPALAALTIAVSSCARPARRRVHKGVLRPANPYSYSGCLLTPPYSNLSLI
ncbi:hypothetical protein B0J12DRAFT_456995 [Macrophomina phaseolina]|uniref:Uncharacterized protein n=1 Tax=Macrophomina phaseolina TaxID=35725 RepID=A0ABQ8GG05_9PEZI|nr:hypothetical protein B0J12DRAFT_456995 [Macrophomina phaseolina]